MNIDWLATRRVAPECVITPDSHRLVGATEFIQLDGPLGAHLIPYGEPTAYLHNGIAVSVSISRSPDDGSPILFVDGQRADWLTAYHVVVLGRPL